MKYFVFILFLVAFFVFEPNDSADDVYYHHDHYIDSLDTICDSWDTSFHDSMRVVVAAANLRIENKSE